MLQASPVFVLEHHWYKILAQFESQDTSPSDQEQGLRQALETPPSNAQVWDLKPGC